VDEMWQGVLYGYRLDGSPACSEVKYVSPSKSWIRRHQREDASLLCRAHGFRWAPEDEGLNIVLFHPDQDVVSFIFTIIEKEVIRD